MSNIKFDSFTHKKHSQKPELKKILSSIDELCVFGSVRQEEEELILPCIIELKKQFPKCTIAIFPKKVDRALHLAQSLQESGLTSMLRTSLNGKSALKKIPAGTILVWDNFGELNTVYANSKAIFVGGSLLQLGGQNFLEPLSYGIKPIIGPYYANFLWLGKELFKKNLVLEVKNNKQLSLEMGKMLKTKLTEHQKQKKQIKQSFQTYLQDKIGGSKLAVSLILKYLG